MDVILISKQLEIFYILNLKIMLTILFKNLFVIIYLLIASLLQVAHREQLCH